MVLLGPSVAWAISCHLGWPLFLQMPLYCRSCLTEKNLLSCPRTSFLSILLQEAQLGGLLDKALTVRPDEGHAPDYGHEGKLLQKDGYWPPLSSLVIHGMFCLFDRSVSLQRGTPSSPLTRPTPSTGKHGIVQGLLSPSLVPEARAGSPM